VSRPRVVLLLTALLVSLASYRAPVALAVSQAGHPSLTSDPDSVASAIDNYLARYPLADQGATFVAVGRQTNIDPRFLVAIAGAESSFGLHVCYAFNAWNYFYAGHGCGFSGADASAFVSWQDAITTVAQGLRRFYFDRQPIPQNTIESICCTAQYGGSAPATHAYCGSGCEHWISNVRGIYTDLGGDTSDLTFFGALPSLRLTLNQTTFGPGETLRLTLRASNGGPPVSIDFYLGHLWPDGRTVSLYTNLSPLQSATTSVSDLAKFKPIGSKITIPQYLDAIYSDVVVLKLPANFPEGKTTLFAALTAPDTLNLVTPLATAEFTFAALS
jgi:hypothetical protein